MASKRLDLPTALWPVKQLNGPRRTSTSRRFLKPWTWSLVSTCHLGTDGFYVRRSRGGRPREPVGGLVYSRNLMPLYRLLESRARRLALVALAPFFLAAASAAPRPPAPGA